ncbi:MAG: 30S ribosomal protein S21 [Chloroflexi bacterium]|nr:30S ribosomal protein S21 [Chloroflexota bacterium]
MSSDVSLRAGETQESLLKRFQRATQMDGILREAKARRHFVSKRDAARIKSRNSAKRRKREGYTGDK